MSELELKPCPFCGGPAEIVNIDEGENEGGSCVCCTTCLASGNVEFEFKENFVNNWNRRVSPLSDGDGWQPIETAKKDGSRMLLWTGSDYVFIGKWEVSDEPDDELDGWWGEDGSWWEPHHWHSLPAPPRDGDYPGLDRHSKPSSRWWRQAGALIFFAGIVVLAVIASRNPAWAGTIEGKTESGNVISVEDIAVTYPPNAPNVHVDDIGTPYLLVQNMEQRTCWAERMVRCADNAGGQFIPFVSFSNSWVDWRRGVDVLASNAMLESKPHFGKAGDGPTVVTDDQFKVGIGAETDGHNPVIFEKSGRTYRHENLGAFQGNAMTFVPSRGTFSPNAEPDSSNREHNGENTDNAGEEGSWVGSSSYPEGFASWLLSWSGLIGLLLGSPFLLILNRWVK